MSVFDTSQDAWQGRKLLTLVLEGTRTTIQLTALQTALLAVEVTKCAAWKEVGGHGLGSSIFLTLVSFGYLEKMFDNRSWKRGDN